MNKLAAAILVFMLIPLLAFAKGSWQADLTQEVTIDPAVLSMFGGMLGMAPGMAGEGSPEAAPPAAGNDPFGLGEPMVSTYHVYYSDNKMRMDMDLGTLKSTTLVDTANNVTWTWNSMEKVAHKLTMPDTSEFAESPMGMSFMEPTDMYMMWDDLVKKYKASDDMEVIELDPKAIGGFDCKGISFFMTEEAIKGLMERTMAEMGGSGPAAGDDAGAGAMLQGMLAPMLGGGISGEIWTSEGIDIPVFLKMDIGMTSISSKLENYSAWTADPKMLKVPEGYEIREDEFGFGTFDMGVPAGPPAPQSV